MRGRNKPQGIRVAQAGSVLSYAGSGLPLRESVDFDNASGLHDGRLLLSLGKARRTLSIDVNSREFFAVMVVNRDLPVTVLAPPITPESRDALFGFCFGIFLH